MVKTVLKIDGMSCSMCEAHMNEVIRNNFKVNKVTSSASAGETVIISDAELDIKYYLMNLSRMRKKKRKVSSTLERNNVQ